MMNQPTANPWLMLKKLALMKEKKKNKRLKDFNRLTENSFRLKFYQKLCSKIEDECDDRAPTSFR